MKETKTSIWIVGLVYSVALLIAVLDSLPQTNTIPWHGLFVIPVVWIALWSAEEDAVPVTMMAMVVSVLILIPGYLSHETSAVGLLSDRLIVISTIWTTVFLALLRKRARRTYKWISLIRPR